MCVVTGLFAHYIKSCRATSLEEAEVDEFGICHDRRLMIIDRASGRFVTQRDHPELAQVICNLTPRALVVTVEGGEHGRLSITRSTWESGERVPGTIWGDTSMTVDQGREARDFFSDLLRQNVLLVGTPPDHARVPSRRPKDVTTGTRFPDGCPFTLTSEASLAALNAELPAGEGPYPMANFRSNIVVTGMGGPWGEDGCSEFYINDGHFHHVKRRTRCPIITTDQRTGERRSQEPLATLERIHGVSKGGGKLVALFGASLIHAGPCTLRVGDKVRNIVRGPLPEA
ncbi:MOSC domain-containing protein [Patescibacteria group bacterium]|nr:MOSC domain-containing protein [Patescibacteria group bacterium]